MISLIYYKRENSVGFNLMKFVYCLQFGNEYNGQII